MNRKTKPKDVFETLDLKVGMDYIEFADKRIDVISSTCPQFEILEEQVSDDCFIAKSTTWLPITVRLADKKDGVMLEKPVDIVLHVNGHEFVLRQAMIAKPGEMDVMVEYESAMVL